MCGEKLMVLAPTSESPTYLIQNGNLMFEQYFRFDFFEHIARLQYHVHLVGYGIIGHRFQLQIQVITIQVLQRGLDAHMQSRNGKYWTADVTDIRFELQREMLDAPVVSEYA